MTQVSQRLAKVECFLLLLLLLFIWRGEGPTTSTQILCFFFGRQHFPQEGGGFTSFRVSVVGSRVRSLAEDQVVPKQTKWQDWPSISAAGYWFWVVLDLFLALVACFVYLWIEGFVMAPSISLVGVKD